MSTDAQSMDVDNGNNESIESNGNHNIDNKDIELSSPSTQKNKLIDKSTTIANGNHDDNNNNNLEEDIDDNIVLKKPINPDSSQSSSSSSSTSPSNTQNNNNDTESKENDDDNNSNSNSYPPNTKIRKIRKIGVGPDGKPMPGFEVVNDDQLAFSSESDFAIFINQISSEIPLQRV